jgi:type VI secretion system protein ImpJ
MAKSPEVLWSEGMFLRPHHLQLASRHSSERLVETARLVQPFLRGVSVVEIDDSRLETFSFGLLRFEGLLGDGTSFSLPGNLALEPRDFRRELDAAGGRLAVHFGVPTVREGGRNLAGLDDRGRGESLRWSAGDVDVADENGGGPSQAIGIRNLNGRFFFGDEDRSGHETIPLALIERAGQGRAVPVVSKELVPPVARIAAWKPLEELCASVLNRVEAKYRFLRAELADGRIAFDSDGTGGWQPILKLQIIGGALPVLRQILSDGRIHPFAVYVELARLAGQLSIFDEGGVETAAVPVYDHDRLADCFHPTVKTLERLLEKILAGRFLRVEFVPRGEILVASLQDEWLAPESLFHLAIESPLPIREITDRLITAKMGAPGDLPLLKQRRLFGLEIEHQKRTPGGLPAREQIHYFSILREGIYWESVARAREVAISGAIDPTLRFSLYIVTRPDREEKPRRP